MTDPFVILEVARDASDEQIKSAYRKKAKQYHPDRNSEPDAEERFKEVTAAYDILRDPVKKQEFLDMGRPRPRPQGAQQGPRFHFGFDGMEDDFLSMLRAQQNARSNDLTTFCTISLEDAFTGKDVTLGINTSAGTRHVSVRSPPGVDDNSRLRVSGAGERLIANQPPGDLYVIIRVTPHQKFSRIAQNLVIQHEIDVFDAILGGETEVPTMDGSPIRVVIPAGTPHGQRMRVSGRGMPVLGTVSQRGDLIITVCLKIPTKLDDRSVELLNEVRQTTRQ